MSVPPLPSRFKIKGLYAVERFEILDEKGNRGNGNGLEHSTAKKFGRRALGRECG